MITFKLIAGIFLCAVWFLIVHIIKMFRMYLVLLEKGVEFKRFVFAYCRTTLINLIIPFKLGEVYRVAVYSKLIKNLGVGIAGVIVDRFFDTLALVLILLPILVLYPAKISMVSVFLIVFVLFIIFVYLMFPSTYKYLNRYIIINRESKRSMAILHWLELLNVGYEHIRKLIIGRYAIITVMSFGAWVLEGGLLFVIAKLVKLKFDLLDFSEYITSILSFVHSEVQQKYTLFSIVLMSVLTLITGIAVFISSGNKRTKKDGKE
ncbi:MAG: lysylphosphatidylglycerol synthase domain-containing protein [Lachnospiraceae bacterium]|nr:lysylphosphatidylglycerol synthase domain-containing protein [Lachnospiraceae bacterium]